MGTFGEKLWFYKNADCEISVRYSEVVEIGSRKTYQATYNTMVFKTLKFSTCAMNVGKYPEA